MSEVLHTHVWTRFVLGVMEWSSSRAVIVLNLAWYREKK